MLSPAPRRVQDAVAAPTGADAHGAPVRIFAFRIGAVAPGSPGFALFILRAPPDRQNSGRDLVHAPGQASLSAPGSSEVHPLCRPLRVLRDLHGGARGYMRPAESSHDNAVSVRARKKRLTPRGTP